EERAQRGEGQDGIVHLRKPLGGVHAAEGAGAAELLQHFQELHAQVAPCLRLEGEGDAEAAPRERRPQARFVGGQSGGFAQVSLEQRLRQRREPQRLAAGADRRQQRLRRRGDEEDVRGRGWLLQALEQGVLRLLRDEVRLVEDEGTRAALERTARDLPHRVPHL